MIKHPLAALACLSVLVACSEGGTSIGPGGLTSPFRGGLVNDDQHFTCEESYDPTTGRVSIKVVHDRGNHVDDTGLHEIASVATAAIGVGKAAGGAVAGARGEFPHPIPPPLNFPACFGTQSLGYAPPAPPNPTPPYPPSQSAQPGPAAFDPGWHEGAGSAGKRTQRLLETVSGDGKVTYTTPGGRQYRISAAAWSRWLEGGTR